MRSDKWNWLLVHGNVVEKNHPHVQPPTVAPPSFSRFHVIISAVVVVVIQVSWYTPRPPVKFDARCKSLPYPLGLLHLYRADFLWDRGTDAQQKCHRNVVRLLLLMLLIVPVVLQPLKQASIVCLLRKCKTTNSFLEIQHFKLHSKQLTHIHHKLNTGTQIHTNKRKKYR